MDDQVLKGRAIMISSRRLQFHSLGDLQILLEKCVNIAIEKGDRAKEGNLYQCFGNVYF